MPFATRSAGSQAYLTPAVRHAPAGLLSLALMDARNQFLALLSHWETAMEQGLTLPPFETLERPEWLAGHVAWFADWWIGRNPRRTQGAACPHDAPRLAADEPATDRWWNPVLAPHARRWEMPLPSVAELRPVLLDQLERTLELLDRTPGSDEGLYFWRVALLHEDLRCEQLVVQAQELGLSLPVVTSAVLALREPLLLPATTWRLGEPGPGLCADIEQGLHEVQVPSFEIDAQPVSWGQMVEFVLDGGYDRQELWAPAGWEWLQLQSSLDGRRGPRHVEQIGGATGAVLQSRFGRSVRMASQQPAMHVSWWEADAYARWAGRRLPTEVEWEIAATQAASRGFRWGDVWEWTAGTVRPWPGFAAAPWTRYTDWEAQPAFGRARVLRGASFATSGRWVYPRRRAFALPQRDDLFVGFRTCSVD